MIQQRNRLAAALQRGFRYRRRTTGILALTFGITSAAVFAASLFVKSTQTAATAPVSSGLALLALFLFIAMIASLISIRRSHPIEEEIYTAQQELEAIAARQAIQLKKERAKARKSISQADQSRHDFLNTMSFELRNPLNSIIGFSSLLYQTLEEKTLQGKRRTYAFDINRSAMHLLNIVNEILDVSNLGTGSADLRIERISMMALLEDCHRLAEVRGTKTGLAFLYNLPQQDFYFNCDPSRMKQILLNLYSNAVKFTDPPGTVTVTVRQTKKKKAIQFIVEDEGIGIPVDDLERVLQRFGKVDSQEYAIRNEDGLGLGLTLVQQLTKMHQGLFKFESTEDVGTKVTITLPGDLMINTNSARS